MVAPCPICQSLKRRMLIERDLLDGYDMSVIATRHRVSRSAVVGHVEQCLEGRPFERLPDADEAPMASPGRVVDMQVQGLTWVLPPDSAYKQFTQAWERAKDDERTRQRMVAFIQEQLQQDDMGIP